MSNPSSSTSTQSPSLDPQHLELFLFLNALDPQWIQWIHTAWLDSDRHSEVLDTLKKQGCPAPKAVLKILFEHPLFELYQKRNQRHQRHNLYQRLVEYHQNLQSRPLLTYPTLSPQVFKDHFYSQLRPVVLTQWAQDWPAIHKWNPQYFQEHFGDIPIEITTNRSQHRDFDLNAHLLKETLTFGEFAQKVAQETQETNDYYLIARNHFFKQDPRLENLFNDLDASDFCDQERQTTSTALWFGPAGTLTPLHHDTCNILFTQIWGEKQFILIPPSQQDLFDASTSMYCHLNPEEALLSSQQLQCTLKPGQTLFIPAGWWHQVRSLSPSISVAMTHFHLPNFVDWYRPGMIR